MKSLVLIDCDGVIFPFATEYTGERVWPDLEPRPVNTAGDEQVIAPQVIEKLSTLMRTSVPFLWLTAWYRQTEHFPATLGFPEFDYVDHPGRATKSWWKLDYVQSIPEDTEVLWIDDDAKDDTETIAWLKTVAERVTCVSPNIYHGISPEELALIDAWVTARAV